MSEKTNKTLDVHEVVKRWLADIRSDQSSRYLYGKRKEHIELLMQYFIEYQIAQDDAEFVRKKVVESLVTSEGMKGKDRHKGWKENTENDFDDAIQLTYVKGVDYSSSPDYKQDPDIVAWAHEKFGNNIPARALKDCHSIGNVLYFSYIEDLRRKQTC